MSDKIILDESIDEFKALKKDWQKVAKAMTADKLPEFIRHLTEDYEHDYGTICHAVAIGAIAAAWAIDKSPQGGITGFQAGAIMWEFILGWDKQYNKTGLRLIDYDNMLYPQHADKFEKTISKSTWSTIQEQAQILLNETQSAHKDVIAHWKSIVSGVMPFGYKTDES